MATKKQTKPKITAKQEGGDDGYCYVVRVEGRKFAEGLTRNEVPYYKEQALKAWEKKNSLEGRVKEAISRTWNYIAADVDWPIDLDGAVELCLDADRPVSFGFLSREDYKEALALPDDTADRWGREVLKGMI